MKIRALIVDDELLARERILLMLEGESDIEVIGQCANGSEAVQAIRAHRPDLLFLDVQMPEMDGFAVLQAVDRAALPAIIFVTAFDQYAVRAFDFHALDYLLKPFDRERFQSALSRARQQLKNRPAGAFDARLAALLEQLRPAQSYAERFSIRSGSQIYFVKVAEIKWIGAAGNYVTLYAGKQEHLLRETMNSVQARLDPDKFFRIHRSTIINIEFVRELQAGFHGDYTVIMQDGTQLTMSRNYRDKLPELFR